jgi:type IV secretory pathway VirB2 component (pilin)
MQHLCVCFLYETLSVLIILFDGHVMCFFAVFVCMLCFLQVILLVSIMFGAADLVFYMYIISKMGAPF